MRGFRLLNLKNLFQNPRLLGFQVTAKSESSSTRTIRVMVDDGTSDFIDEANQRNEYSFDKTTKIFSVSLPANQQTVIFKRCT